MAVQPHRRQRAVDVDVHLTASANPRRCSGLALAATLGCAAVGMVVLLRVEASAVPSALGFGWPTARALTTAELVSVVCLIGYRLFPALTGQGLALRP